LYLIEEIMLYRRQNPSAIQTGR